MARLSRTYTLQPIDLKCNMVRTKERQIDGVTRKSGHLCQSVPKSAMPVQRVAIIENVAGFIRAWLRCRFGAI